MTDPALWRVLVVDDDAGMRETLSEILAAHDIQRARDAGMTDYLVKPVSPSALAQALSRIVG